MSDLRIAIIGAGSLVWSATLIHDLCLTPDLHGSTIVFMDINKERLDIVYNFARRYASEVKANLSFEKTLNREEAIRDSDFVINTAMAKGHYYYESMREASEKCGYYRGINSTEWNMVSDYHTIWGYYQFKLALDVARDVEDHSRNAWLIQLSNPVFELTTLISRKTKAKVIGVCHGHLGYKDIVKVLGINEKEVEAESVGVNHVIWLTKFTYRGEDAYPLLDEWIEKEAEKYWERWYWEQTNPFDVHMSPAAVDMYRRYGLFPVGDTVRGGTWKYHWDLETKKRWYGPMGGPDSEIGWMMYLKYNEIRMNALKEALIKGTGLRYFFPEGRSGEPVIPIVESLACDKPGVHQVNVPNKGLLEGLPSDVAVEVPATLDGKGVHGLGTKRLPARILNLVMQPRVMRMEWALEAFLEGGRDVLFDWLMLDPRTRSTEQAEKAIDAVLSLPGNEEMARHFR
ncbi:MAG: alpha-glucosidase/alpha-galactosidase [Thermoprotei archaeon]|nr:MAG: alpha-glucosidase/alpha-galactosidase [Thermoprotei archaeon]